MIKVLGKNNDLMTEDGKIIDQPVPYEEYLEKRKK